MSKTLDHIREEYKRLQDEYYKPENAFQRDYINGKIYAYAYHEIMIMLDSEERNGKMNSKEIVAYKCSECGQAYLDKSVADNCCKPKHCEDCGVEIPRSHPYVVCDKCRHEREAKQELERYNKAIKYTFESAPKESIEMLYSELYPYNEGFMTDIDDDDVEEYGIKYVYGTKLVLPSYDAWDMVESMLEESFEDATDHINEEELNKLQSAIDTFIGNHNGALNSYEIDYNVVIDL